jgi:hypothetical protein
MVTDQNPVKTLTNPVVNDQIIAHNNRANNDLNIVQAVNNVHNSLANQVKIVRAVIIQMMNAIKNNQNDC